jgi:hypothetical protein
MPVHFRSKEGEVDGECVNISESGMLALFNPPLNLWLNGQLSIVIGECKVNITARVVRTEGLMTGFTFRTINSKNIALLRELIERA